MKKDLKVRLVGGVLVATVLASTLKGCGSTLEAKEVTNEKEEQVVTTMVTQGNKEMSKAGININDDNALIFLENYDLVMYSSNDTRNMYIRAMVDNPFSDVNCMETYIGNVCEISYFDKDDLEDKVKDLIGEDGQISYHKSKY